MSIFKFDETKVVRKKSALRNPKVIFGVALLIAIPAIGNTLASSITVNTNSRVEFGQGQTQTVSCQPTASAITVTPTSNFTNGSGLGTFNLGTITVSGILDACNGKVFTLKPYDDQNANPLTTITVTYDKNVASNAAYSTGISGGTVVAGGSAGSFVVTPSASISADQVYKITVETSDA